MIAPLGWMLLGASVYDLLRRIIGRTRTIAERTDGACDHEWSRVIDEPVWWRHRRCVNCGERQAEVGGSWNTLSPHAGRPRR